MNYRDLKNLQLYFYELTKDLTPKEWREMRTSIYWQSDKMDAINSINHKITVFKNWRKINK